MATDESPSLGSNTGFHSSSNPSTFTGGVLAFVEQILINTGYHSSFASSTFTGGSPNDAATAGGSYATPHVAAAMLIVGLALSIFCLSRGLRSARETPGCQQGSGQTPREGDANTAGDGDELPGLSARSVSVAASAAARLGRFGVAVQGSGTVMGTSLGEPETSSGPTLARAVPQRQWRPATSARRWCARARRRRRRRRRCNDRL